MFYFACISQLSHTYLARFKLSLLVSKSMRKKRQRHNREWWKGKNCLYVCEKKNMLMDGENKGVMEEKEKIKEENERENGREDKRKN